MIKIDKIKGLMRKNGETQSDIAMLLCKKLRTIQYNFHKRNFSVEEIVKIAKHYGVNVADLIE